MKLTVQGTSIVDDAVFIKDGAVLAPYRAHLAAVVSEGGYAADEASLNVLDDEAMRETVKACVAAKTSSVLKAVIVVGIGGANLGAKAIYDVLYGYTDVWDAGRAPKMLFVDTCNPALISAAQAYIARLGTPDEVVIVVASKSGGTTETMVNTNAMLGAMESRFGEAYVGRVVVLSDEGSLLWDLAGAHGMTRIAIPAKVGGRFSVFSPMGLVPLALCGMDIDALVEGAREARAEGLREEVMDNPAMSAAIAIYAQMERGAHVLDYFMFHPELESIGRWARQLVAESLGKSVVGGDGQVVRCGVTPTVSLGSTDLHSVVQLNLAGPRDKMTMFVSAGRSGESASMEIVRFFPDAILATHSVAQIMDAILQGTQAAYRGEGLPFMSCVLEDLSPRTLGGLLQQQMMMTMYLGALLGVSTFDQPAVELYKKEVKKILSNE